MGLETILGNTNGMWSVKFKYLSWRIKTIADVIFTQKPSQWHMLYGWYSQNEWVKSIYRICQLEIWGNKMGVYILFSSRRSRIHTFKNSPALWLDMRSILLFQIKSQIKWGIWRCYREYLSRAIAYPQIWFWTHRVQLFEERIWGQGTSSNRCALQKY